MNPACPLSSHSSSTPTLTLTRHTHRCFLEVEGEKAKKKVGLTGASAFPSALAFSTQAKSSWTERGSILLMEKSLVPMAFDAALE